jgi:hypothetical protein
MFGKTRDKLILRLLDEAGRDRALIDGSRDVIGRIDAEVVRLRTKLRSNAIRIGELEVKLRGAQSSRDLVYLNHTNTLDLLDRARVEIQSLTEKLAAKERGILSQRSYIQSLRYLEEVTASRALSYGRKITRAYKALTDETDTHAAIELALEALEEFHPVNDNGVIQVPVGPVTPAGPKKTKNVNCRCARWNRSPGLWSSVGRSGKGVAEMHRPRKNRASSRRSRVTLSVTRPWPEVTSLRAATLPGSQKPPLIRGQGAGARILRVTHETCAGRSPREDFQAFSARNQGRDQRS